MDGAQTYAGFWRRFVAYLIDVLPITLGIATIFYMTTDFDVVMQRYLNEQGNLQARIDFLQQRNQVRDLSLIVWLIYSMIADCSPLQGTHGKRILAIKVVDAQGQRLSVGRSLARNSMKLVSFIPLGLGAIWAAFSPRKQAWHDLASKCFVICK